MPTPRSVVLLFVDGLGVGPLDPSVNPLAEGDWRVLSGVARLASTGPWSEPDRAGRCLDAAMGVAGTPQSATGQTALLTGLNAPALAGRHVSGLPGPTLRRVIATDSIFARLARRGVIGDFANAFTPEFFPYLRRRRLSVTTWATLAGGRPLATLADLTAGRAVYQDFTNLCLRQRGYDLPLWTPARAGSVLARLARRRGFLLYEYFLTDRAGHAGDPAAAAALLTGLDDMLAICLAEVDPTTTLTVLVSDHGNIEDLGRAGHTRHPVPLLGWGVGAADLIGRVNTLDQLTPAIVDLLT